jgi:D-tyrosyl-tRNA(Tyr) deacylase
MRLVVQRVKRASVYVVEKKKEVGRIGKGLLVLVGIGKGDTNDVAKTMAQKLSNLRIMSDKKGKMNLSTSEVGGSILVVSQFTLHADTSKGNRPSFVKAAEPGLAKEIYETFVAGLKNLKQKVATGEFGEYMKIKAELDGPVTILMDSEK